MKRKLNWTPSRGDIRDHEFKASEAILLSSFDNTDIYTKTWDQR